MSQDIFNDIDPTATSGTQLATTLNGFKDAIASGMSGTSRPTNLQAGGGWIDTTDAGSNLWYYKIYDGSDDILVFTIDLANNSVSVTGSSSTFQVTKTSADTVGALLTLKKERVASNGQVLDGDTIGELRFNSTDDAGGDETTCRIKAVATDDVTVSASGSYLVFECTPDTEGAIEEMMRLVDNKLGIGTTTPNAELHAKGTLGIKHERETDDALASIVAMEKKRLSGDGAVDSGDAIGQLDYRAQSSDSNIDEVAQIEVTATEDHTATNKGTRMSVKITKDGEASLTEKIRIDDQMTIYEACQLDAPIMGKEDVATAATIAALTANKHLVRMTGSTETTIQGIEADHESKVILIHNDSTADIILAHENSSATAADRLHLPEDTDIVIGPDASVELFYSTDDTRWKLKSGSGTGSGGGSGEYNYFDTTSSLTEKSVGSWLSDDGAGSAEASLTLSVTTSASEKLSDDGSLKVAKAAADISGSFVKLASTTIQRIDQLKGYLFGSFDYDFTDTNYASNNCYVRLWDNTNDEELYVGPIEDRYLKKTSGTYSYQVNLNSDTAEVELQIVWESTDTDTYFFVLDNIKLGRSARVAVQAVSGWQNYTPTTQGFGTISSVNFEWRRDGSDMLIRGSFQAGTTTAAEAQIGLPTGYMVKSGLPLTNVGYTFGSAVSIPLDVLKVLGGETYMTVGTQSASDAGSSDRDANAVYTSSETVYLSTVRIPIEGWNFGTGVSESQVSVTSDRVDARGNAGTVLTANTTDIDFITVKNLHGGWDGSKYTALKSGPASMKGQIYISANANVALYSYINGVSDKLIGYLNNSSRYHPFNWDGELNKGDELSVRSATGATLTNNTALHWINVRTNPNLTLVGAVSNRGFFESEVGTLGTVTWNSATPSGTFNGSYQWIRDGKRVDLWVWFDYSSTAASNDFGYFSRPSDVPVPKTRSANSLLATAVGSGGMGNGGSILEPAAFQYLPGGDRFYVSMTGSVSSNEFHGHMTYYID